jgi:hypothetical protein
MRGRCEANLGRIVENIDEYFANLPMTRELHECMSRHS